MSFCKERQKNLHVSKETIEQGVDTMINDFISHLESLRASFKQRLEKYEQDESKTLENQISNLSNLLSRAKYQKQLLTVSVEQGSNEECLVERENILKSEGEIKKNSSVFPVKIPYDGKLSFHADSEFLNLKSKLTTIGRYIELEKGCMKRRKIKMLYKKDLNCVICSAVFDHQGNIIIADYAHKKVFACDLSLNCKSTILVPGKPWDITCNRAGLIFVSLPFEREVIELDIKNGVVNKLFSTSANCRGLCWMNDKFYIASSIGLQIYSDVGVKEDEIQMFNTWMLSEKQDLDCILCTKNDELMEISVHSKKKKTLFERFGSVFRGISTDYEGNIYTVGMSSSKLYQLSSDGNLIRELNLKDFHLKGNLWSIRLSDKNKFVITTDEGCVALFEMTDDV
ncbi:uncharacterized protein LOC134246263 [Saccostrea cucullata]|uniref:uncharacterized protein LOC134246263 n=1 Tax=Saccostrea cuccullata TaxID=36930 RepID=UPI002ED3D0E5